MRSNPKMIFNCSIDTLWQIFKEPSLSKELCETKISKALLFRDKYTITSFANDEYLKVEFTERKFTTYEIEFYKVSDSIVKCEVKGFSLIAWVIFIVLTFIVGSLVKSSLIVGLSFFLVFWMMLRALGYYININSKCARIKKNYESSETFIRINNHLVSEPHKNKTINYPDEVDVENEVELRRQKIIKVYHIHNGLKEQGSFKLTELQGKISNDTYVWQEGMPDWVLAKEIPELKNLIPQTPPAFKLSVPKNIMAPPEFNPGKIPPIFNSKS